MVKAQVYKYVKHFNGFPTDDNIQLVKEDLPELKDGEVLFEAEYLSLDPYMRSFMPLFPEGSVMIGEQVAKVTQSKNPKYKVNSHHLVSCGWRSHTVLNPDEGKVKPVPEGMSDLPLSLALGTVGMPGATAHIALIKEMKIEAGKTILVNGTVGATGQVACQIGKIKGCKVIGCAGSAEKCNFLKSLGIDVVFNYKKDDIAETINAAAPDGINYYLDGVGGQFTSTILLKCMAKNGQIIHIGSMESYNETKTPQGDLPFAMFTPKSLTMKGTVIFEYPDSEWNTAHQEIIKWIKEGKLTYKENITQGFENMRKAFYDLFTGANFGKAVIKV